MTTLRRVGRDILLRDWEERDLEDYGTWLDPSQSWREFDGPYYPVPTTAEIAKNIEALRPRVVEGDWSSPRVTLPIVKIDGEELVGRVSRYWQSEETDWLSLGVAVYDPRRWGKGIGS